MASNKFFTIMIVPEKSHQVKKIVVPSYVFKGGIVSFVFLTVLAIIMVLDYANVMNQINENKQLKIENRQLRQSVQVFKTKMVTIENAMDRVKTFVTKLRIITNIEESASPLAPGQAAPPPAAPSLPSAAPQPKTSEATPPPAQAPAQAVAQMETTQPSLDPNADPYEVARSKRLTLLASMMSDTYEGFTLTDADNSAFVKSEFEKLDAVYEEVNRFTLATELETQDLLERLGEKRAFLAARPTVLPTKGGYISSEYGPRSSPFDGRMKMHEGIDIANRYGADVIAPGNGIVSFAGYKEGYGKVIILDHETGIETLFGHSSKIYVKQGDRVKRGQKIGAIGNTGHSTGPHCHYEVRAGGLPVDPCAYILDSSCSRLNRSRTYMSRQRPTDPDLIDRE